MASLTRNEADERFALIERPAYDVTLDLDRGADTFASTTRLTFASSQPGAASWIDVKASEIHAITWNGSPVDPSRVVDSRLPLPDLRADNELIVEATMAYSRDGQGLHRACDRADGQHYVYGHLFLDAAPRVFACFDQPDLKAPYTFHVTAPRDWVVVGNGAESRVEDRVWELATTKPLSTYFVTLCAGPYAVVEDSHDGIPLRLMARQSLSAELSRHAEHLFGVTKQSFDYYHDLFGIRYPFGKYDQVFVPEFNAGAMENPGCVTFRDQMLFRGAATRDQVLARANTVAHEMAHMWFGDLVTMKWWDDLWLNESFAEYMAGRTLCAATEFTDSWVQSSIARKSWGYAAERAPSAHPVAGTPALDAESALQNFDGISYAKGSSVLRQLIAYVGDESFVAGVTAYLQAKSYGNGTFADFVAAIEGSSGRSLKEWAQAWLLTSGRDTLSMQVEADGQVVQAARLCRVVPADQPADRPHSLDIAGFSAGDEDFRVEVTLDRDEVDLPQVVGRPRSRLMVPNAADLSWAAVDFDAETLAAMPEELALVPSADARAMIWTALEDGVYRATVDPRTWLQIFATAWPGERDVTILGRVALGSMMRSGGALGIVGYALPPSQREAATALLASSAMRLLERTGAGEDAAEGTEVAAARLLARTSDDETLLRAWLVGEQLPGPLRDDTDFRWLVIGSLAAAGRMGVDELTSWSQQDPSMAGNLAMLCARASMPTAEAKAWAWHELTTDSGRSNYELVSLAQGFWRAPDVALTADYVSRYFEEVPAMRSWVGEDALARVATALYPTEVSEAFAALSAQALAREDLTAAVRRAMVDEDAVMRAVLASRRAFG